jgi:lipid A disaccharide synthetase
MNPAAAQPTTAGTLRVESSPAKHSGDQLGAALIAALRERVPQLSCFGVAGRR